MSVRSQWKLIAILWLIVAPAITVWAIKNGSPQAVWLYCDMLGWCKP